jgi:hypothetical protein
MQRRDALLAIATAPALAVGEAPLAADAACSFLPADVSLDFDGPPFMISTVVRRHADGTVSCSEPEWTWR